VKVNQAFIGSGHRIETGIGRDSQDPPVALVTRQRERTVTICMGYHLGRELTSRAEEITALKPARQGSQEQQTWRVASIVVSVT
ncbi:Hypothetical predicted protein, partial [Marmota monax]